MYTLIPLLMSMFFLCFMVPCIGKTAFITGISGQDGYYLAQLLLGKGYEVHGLVRITAAQKDSESPDKGIMYHYGDLDEIGQLVKLLKTIKPDEVYNLAVQSQVAVTYVVPEYSARSNALGVLTMLEALRLAGLVTTTKFFQAASCEIFGRATQVPQSEKTPFAPSSPYGVAKLFGYWITINYREAYGMFTCNGILFNHESPRRGETFVTRKITRAVAAIHYGLQEVITLGNLDVKKDWGYAKDYVEAMWLMLQQDTPDDYVIASGQAHTVRDFVEAAFKATGTIIVWQGEGVHEVGIDANTHQVRVRIDARYFRPLDVSLSVGDISKAKNNLGWLPKTNFEDLVRIMVKHDMDLLAQEKAHKDC